MFGSENFILSSPLMLICIAISALISFCEYKFRRKWIFITGKRAFLRVCLRLVSVVWGGAFGYASLSACGAGRKARFYDA